MSIHAPPGGHTTLSRDILCPVRNTSGFAFFYVELDPHPLEGSVDVGVGGDYYLIMMIIMMQMMVMMLLLLLLLLLLMIIIIIMTYND